MFAPMNPLPNKADDPRLDNWYHTIELAPGLVTRAVWDNRPMVDKVGLPESLAGKTALDVGTANGFWAFELERRGADRVVAIDVARLGEVDLIPIHRARCDEATLNSTRWREQFATAHKMLGSRVEFQSLNVYELSPETVGTFDVTYCGSMLLHLMNPLQALINIRSVTKQIAVIETAAFHADPIDAIFPDKPYMWFGRLDAEGPAPGSAVSYWSFTSRALSDMLIYAGFSWVEPMEPYQMQRADKNSAPLTVSPVVAHVAPNPALKGFRMLRRTS